MSEAADPEVKAEEPERTATRPPAKPPMKRRRDDKASQLSQKKRTALLAATREQASKPVKKNGAALRSEIAIPVGIGAVVALAALGIIALLVQRTGGPTALVVAVLGLGCVAGLTGWIVWIVDTVAARPVARVRAALLAMEEGDYDARVKPGGAEELRELSQGFNRMATIVGHQRERLKQLAATDGLTGLANHRHFHELLRESLQKGREQGVPMAVVALDIDGFKKVNDERGHSRGDEVLRAAAEALQKSVRGADLVARLGGDDFALLLEGADGPYARQASDRAREALARVLPEELSMTTSAGFVCYPEVDDINMTEFAARALDLAKRAGGGITRKYDAEQVAAIPTIRNQRAEIDALLDMPNPITPVFQPLVELHTGRLVGYEALSRFNADVRRPPDAWFNQAHACGRGPQLEAIAIRAALEAPERPPGTYLSLNFSPSAISSNYVTSALPLNLNGLVIEITEHELASEDGALEEGLARLRQRGARIAVDDAGAGYAGLNQVMRVQPDIIKLDRSLIEDIHLDSAKAALVEFFAMFARRVGAGVCTEGIEKIEELQTLVNLGIYFGQGYLLGRPAEPWATVSPDIVRTLATGALRTHAPTRPGGGAGGAGASAGPVNRRLHRYGSTR
jgi:diguanylate cyclase (GGDEF)-like protein